MMTTTAARRMDCFVHDFVLVLADIVVEEWNLSKKDEAKKTVPVMVVVDVVVDAVVYYYYYYYYCSKYYKQ